MFNQGMLMQRGEVVNPYSTPVAINPSDYLTFYFISGDGSTCVGYNVDKLQTEIYLLSSGVWTLQTTLSGHVAGPLSYDGNVLASSPKFYRRSGVTWTQDAVDCPLASQNVGPWGLSGNGLIVAAMVTSVGGSAAGSGVPQDVVVATWAGSYWTTSFLQVLTTNVFGTLAGYVELSHTGTVMITSRGGFYVGGGTSLYGWACVLTTSSNWATVATRAPLTRYDVMGPGISISGDGGSVAVCAAAGVYIYTGSGTTWTSGTLYPSSVTTGRSVAIDNTGVRLVASCVSTPQDAGGVSFGRKIGSTWTEDLRLAPGTTGAEPYYGPVRITYDGLSYLVASQPSGTGVTYLTLDPYTV